MLLTIITIQDLTGANLKDYDLIINVARTGIEGAVKVIKEYVANNPK